MNIKKREKNKVDLKKPLDHKIMKKHKKGRTKYISFGSLKELPVQRWWFKSTPKLRSYLF